MRRRMFIKDRRTFELQAIVRYVVADGLFLKLGTLYHVSFHVILTLLFHASDED